jgi:hypothetical protein
VELDPRSSICPRCGVAQLCAPGQGHPNGVLALVLNIFFPGVGTLVLGKVGTGVTQILLGILAIPLWFVGIGFLLSLGVWIWAVVIAAQSLSGHS